MSKLAFRAQAVDIAYLPLRQDFLPKNVLMTAQRDFRLGNSLLTIEHHVSVFLPNVNALTKCASPNSDDPVKSQKDWDLE
jgi:hypothetical protein